MPLQQGDQPSLPWQQHRIMVLNHNWSAPRMSALPHPLQHLLRENNGWRTWRPWRNSQCQRQDNYKLTFCWLRWHLAGQEQKLVKLVNHLEEASTAYGMQISAEKTQLMTNNTNGISTDITIDNKKLETNRSFRHLGAIVSDEGSKPEAISSKIRLMRPMAMSIFLYACETWTITVDIERRIQALEMRYFRKLLGISYRDHTINEEVKARFGIAIGPYEDLLTSVKRRKLKWYGHVTCSSGLAKTILQGTVQGGRRRGRQRKRWEDNIKEWTGLEWNIILRKAENREEWRKLVVKSTVVPQWSARLRDR